MPALAELRAALPEARIHFLTRARYAGLLELSPLIDRVELLGPDEGLGSLVRRLRRDGGGAEVVLDLHRSLRSRLVAVGLGLPVWRGAGNHLARRRMLGRVSSPGVQPVWEGHGQTVQRMLDALEQAGRVGYAAKGPGEAEPGLASSPLLVAPLEARRQVAKQLGRDRGDGGPRASGRRRVALLIGAQWANKRWPVARFIEVGRALASRGLEPVIIAGPAEADDVAAVAAGIDGPTHTCTGAWAEVVAWLEHCESAIGNDSGMTHLAEALGLPVVALFGPTVPGFGFAPRLPASRAVQVPLECRPCSLHGGDRCPLGHHACLAGLEAPVVLAAFDALGTGMTAGG